MRLDRQQRRRHALARNDNHQIHVVGHRAAERPRIIEDRDVTSPGDATPSGAVGVAPAFALKKDQQLVGAARGQAGPRVMMNAVP